MSMNSHELTSRIGGVIHLIITHFNEKDELELDFIRISVCYVKVTLN